MSPMSRPPMSQQSLILAVCLMSTCSMSPSGSIWGRWMMYMTPQLCPWPERLCPRLERATIHPTGMATLPLDPGLTSELLPWPEKLRIYSVRLALYPQLAPELCPRPEQPCPQAEHPCPQAETLCPACEHPCPPPENLRPSPVQLCPMAEKLPQAEILRPKVCSLPTREQLSPEPEHVCLRSTMPVIHRVVKACSPTSRA